MFWGFFSNSHSVTGCIPFGILMSSMQCVEEYMVTLKDVIFLNIRLDKKRQLRKQLKK